MAGTVDLIGLVWQAQYSDEILIGLGVAGTVLG